MKKNHAKAQASSVQNASTGAAFGSGFGNASTAFGAGASRLSYLAEQPDISSLSDSNLVVIFRNLSKKDTTTKAKALEELQAFVSELKSRQDEVDESFLTAWIKVYPRLSIEVDRRVRQLSHVVHGLMISGSGKKAARHMQDCVGSWVSGCYEGDRVVAKAATDAFALVFPTAEKQESINKVYQLPILDFCKEALLHESAKSLSDERTTKSEDADAKHYRLVASSLSLLRGLLEKLSSDEIRKQEPLYQEVLSSKDLWAFAESKDSAVRRALLRLIPVCLQAVHNLIKPSLSRVFGALLSSRSIKSQGGSALEYSSVLGALTSDAPDLWYHAGTQLSSALSKYADLVKCGSQGASGQYWTNLTNILQSMPIECLPQKAAEAKKVLSALRTGITRKDEPRSSATEAWNCYDAVLGRLLLSLPTEEQDEVLTDMAFTIVSQYLQPSSEHTSWTITARQPVVHVSSVFALPRMLDIAATTYPPLADKLIEDIRTSAPEQSKDFDTSQSSVLQAGARWFELQKGIMSTTGSEPFHAILRSTSSRIVSASIDTLKAREGKPYSAAGIIETGIRQVKSLLISGPENLEVLEPFIQDDLPALMLSRSSSYLVSILFSLQDHPLFLDAFSKALDVVLTGTDSMVKEQVLRSLLTAPNIPPSAIGIASNNNQLQEFFSGLIEQAMSGEVKWKTVAAYLTTSKPALSSSNVDATLADLTSRLTLDTEAADALSGLETVAEANSSLLEAFSKTENGSALINNLLSLLESNDDSLANRSTALNTKLSTGSARGQGPSVTTSQSVIVGGLSEAGPNSLAVETLIDFAKNALKDNQDVSPQDFFLPIETWWKVLRPLIDSPVSQALAGSTDLGSLTLLMDSSSPKPQGREYRATFDKSGFSAPLRIAMSTLVMLEETSTMVRLSPEHEANIYRLLLLTSQLANDALSLSGTNAVFYPTSIHAEDQVVDFVSGTSKAISVWLSAKANGTADGIDDEASTSASSVARQTLFEDSAERSPFAYQSARAYSRITQLMMEAQSGAAESGSDLENKFRQTRKDSSFFQLLGLVSGYEATLSLTPLYTRVCNELVASLTSLDASSKPDELLQQLVLANTMLQEQDHVVDSIAKQRIIFLVKHMTPWLHQENVPDGIRNETCRLMSILLPAINEVYGDHWSEVISFVRTTCALANPTEAQLRLSPTVPLLQTTLRLSTILRSLTRDEDVNEDLTDAWKESTPELSAAFVSLLKKLAKFPDQHNQPLRSLNEALSRQIAALPPTKLEDINDIYPLVTSESQPIQKTAFDLLHRRIPAMQEQISLDAALDKATARLPEELLSLILDPLTLDSLADASFERDMPHQARGYLSSWLLIFDHFRNASYKVCDDYTAHLKEGDYISPLLNFISGFLGHSRGKPIDPSKFEVTIYSFDVQDDPLKDLQWLLIHLYYLTLKRVPTLAKAWWMDCRSRQTVQNIESWTEKYISPSVIADVLSTVSTWAETQDANADDALIIKPNAKTKEITLAKELDAQLLSIAIKLPPTYPLAAISAHSISRIAIESRKWDSYVRNTAGVIAFSNNSVIAGIVAFKRNISGALKGQTECAICYSIVGADKQLPTKRCGTCKNLFHGSCLYRWFKSSNSSSCPLCRNAFNYS